MATTCSCGSPGTTVSVGPDGWDVWRCTPCAEARYELDQCRRACRITREQDASFGPSVSDLAANPALKVYLDLDENGHAPAWNGRRNG